MCRPAGERIELMLFCTAGAPQAVTRLSRARCIARRGWGGRGRARGKRGLRQVQTDGGQGDHRSVRQRSGLNNAREAPCQLCRLVSVPSRDVRPGLPWSACIFPAIWISSSAGQAEDKSAREKREKSPFASTKTVLCASSDGSFRSLSIFISISHLVLCSASGTVLSRIFCSLPSI